MNVRGVAASILLSAAVARGQWSTPVNLTSINTVAGEVSAAPCQGGTVLFLSIFDRPGGQGGYDIWTSQLSGGQFQAPVNPGPPLNTPDTDAFPSPSPAGDRVHFVSNRPGTMGFSDIFVSDWNGTAWSSPALLPATVNSIGNEFAVHVTPAGDTMFFASDRVGGNGSQDLYTSLLVSGSWTSAVNLGGLVNGADYDSGPFLGPSGTDLYFFSFRSTGLGQADIYRSSYVSGAWQAPVNLGAGPSSIEWDGFPALLSNGGAMYFSSTRTGGSGNTDIWLTWQPIAITTTSLPRGRTGRPYGAALVAFGGVEPWTFTLLSGTLPPGLSLSTAGLISGTPTATGSYPFTARVADRLGNTAQKSLTIDIASPTALPDTIVAAPGPDSAAPPTVGYFRSDGSPAGVSFAAYGATGYGANVALGQLDGAGYPEVVTGPGPGAVYGPQVRAFDDLGAPLGKVSFYAYGTLRYGVGTGGGELDADGFDEILTGAGPGAVFGPHVRAFDFDGAAIAAIAKVNFFAYGTLKWGVNVAGGDVDGDGYHEILTGPGPGGVFPAQLRGFDYDGGTLASMAKINAVVFSGQTFGLHVAAGSIDADAADEILAGSGPDPAFGASFAGLELSGSLATLFSQAAYGAPVQGVRVAAGGLDLDAPAEIATMSGAAAAPSLRGWSWDGGPVLQPVPATQFSPYAAFGTKAAVGSLGY